MDILLRVMNGTTREGLFIDENLKTYSKEDLLSLLERQKINNLSLAKRNGRVYIKSKPNTRTVDNISHKSISHIELISFYKDVKGAAKRRCMQISTEFYQMAKSILL